MNKPETQSGGSLKPVGSVRTDTQRLNWLLESSGLDPSDCEGQAVYLIVTRAAVQKCADTHGLEYHAAVRAVIDAAMSTERCA